MDWLKLFALLVAVASVEITAEGPKKKIRIHLPQKVKHIHHHKKIYITNHPAPSQYAPAFLAGVKGGLELQSNAPRPTVTGIMPLNSVELYDEGQPRLPHISSASSNLLPLYRARGRYGPDQSEWDDQEYDMDVPREHNDIYAPSGYSVPPQTNTAASVSNHPKRVKYVKVNELPRKKVVHKKPKRVIVRAKLPHKTPSPPPPLIEEEHPVSTFHEQFYSDLEEAGTISKVKKPPRIEKIVDGDTEHIHTYSEEHIHKVVFDDDSKVTGVVGVDPVGSMSSINAAHPLIPLKNAQTLVAVPNLAVVGSMGTPSHLEYAAYSPHDVTHDHIFHDHGEIPSNIEVTKETLRLPPKISYNSLGLPISTPKRFPNKPHRLYSKPTKPTSDFSYYENLFNRPGLIPKKPHQSVIPSPYGVSANGDLTDFRPLPSIRFKEGKKKHKSRPFGKQIIPNFQASVPSPFAVSSTIVHDYEPKHYGPVSATFSKFGESFNDFKDHYGSDFEYDTYAASSNIHTSEDKNDSTMMYQPKEKKSVSTQNVIFGGQDHQTFVDHVGSVITPTENDQEPTALEDLQDNFEYSKDSIAPTPYTIRETSPAHPYYTAMALKALHESQPEASNKKEMYIVPPETTEAATEPTVLNTTTSQPHVQFFKIQSTDAIAPPEPNPIHKPNKKRRDKNPGHRRHRYLLADFRDELSQKPRHAIRLHSNKHDYLTDTSGRGNLKYGDKI